MPLWETIKNTTVPLGMTTMPAQGSGAQPLPPLKREPVDSWPPQAGHYEHEGTDNGLSRTKTGHQNGLGSNGDRHITTPPSNGLNAAQYTKKNSFSNDSAHRNMTQPADSYVARSNTQQTNGGGYGIQGQGNTKAPAKSMTPRYGSMGAAAMARMIIAPFRGARGASSYRRDVYYAALREYFSSYGSHQHQHAMESTEKVVERASKENLHVLESVTLGGGAVGHWLYKSNSKYVMLYFHGGCYVQPMSAGHAKYLFALQRKINRMGYDFSIFALSYSLAPETQYPGQLIQAVAALKYLLDNQGRNPRHIMIGGDSAGGNLASALLLHLANPHPNVNPIHLNGPLRGALLISPWVSFDTTAPSFKKNRYSDYMPLKAFKQAASAFAGSEAELDEYAEPLRAPVESWQGVAGKVGEILIWGGGSEVLIDGIREFAVRVEVGFEREFQERGTRRANGPAIGVLGPDDGDKERDLFDDSSDVSKSPLTPEGHGTNGFNFDFSKRAGYNGAVRSADSNHLHPNSRGPEGHVLQNTLSPSVAEDLHVIDEAEAAPAGINHLEAEAHTERKAKRASMAVEEEDYEKVPALYPDPAAHEPLDGPHPHGHPLEQVISPSTAEDIHLIDAVAPAAAVHLDEPVAGKKPHRKSMAENEESDYLHVQQAAVPEPPPTLDDPARPALTHKDSPTTAQDVHLIENIIVEAEAENVADRASVSDYGDHGPLPGDNIATAGSHNHSGGAGVRHSWGIHRLSGSHGNPAYRKSMAEREQDDYLHVPAYNGPTTPAQESVIEWPRQDPARRVKYIETPRMAHEEMIIDYALKFGGKREGARSIERWFEQVLGTDRARASMMPLATGEEERKRYLRGEGVNIHSPAGAIGMPGEAGKGVPPVPALPTVVEETGK